MVELEVLGGYLVDLFFDLNYFGLNYFDGLDLAAMLNNGVGAELQLLNWQG
jgi:hypothetical protein